MMASTTIEQRRERCFAALRERGQEHLLHRWKELDPDQQTSLLDQIESIPWDVVDPLIATHVMARPVTNIPKDIQPAPIYRSSPQPNQQPQYEDAHAIGEKWMRTDRVAAFTVAGGQGTRLGFDGPKGAVVVTPAGDRTLFQIFAATVKAVRRRYRATIPWYVMTSQANHDQTLTYFEENHFFDLPPEDVILFRQGMLPTFDFEGHILMESKDRLALAPDGHGGSLKALVHSGALSDMKQRGVSVISYFQVDNPLVKPFDPLFIGLHINTGSEMSTKVTPKSDDLEEVGNVCLRNGKVSVIEYSEFPATLAHEKNKDGSRKFNAGNLAIHLLNVDFVDRVVGQSFRLPFCRAEKAVPFLNDQGHIQQPQAPNAIKLESFIFDALPLAKNPLVLDVEREEEFSPVKNTTGVDSLDTAKRDQIARAYRWLEKAGATPPRKVNGDPDASVAIFPSFALSAADVETRKDELPEIQPGDRILIE